MQRQSILKLIGLFILFGLLAVAQPLAKELNLELNQLQTGISGLPKNFAAKSLMPVTDPAFDSTVTPSEPPSSPAEPSIQKNVLGASTSAALFSVYPVTKVVDGDTIKVNIEGKIETVRVIGLNTPETVDPRKPVECFGKEASDRAKSLLTGQKVSLEFDASQGDKDKYDRLLRYVFLEDGTDFGLTMIKNGYGYEYLYDEPYKYRESYVEAQQTAEQSKLGLWSETTCAVQ